MPSSKHILLLTGAPGIGKTTVIQKVTNKLTCTVAGFYTEEIRENKIRQGFELVTLDGDRIVIAHTKISSTHRVSKYRVNVSAIDSAVESTLSPDPNIDIYIVDEIGKMECFSRQFIQAMEALFDSGEIVVATIALKGRGFISEVKNRNDIELWEVTRNNRNSMSAEIVNWIRKVKKDKLS